MTGIKWTSCKVIDFHPSNQFTTRPPWRRNKVQKFTSCNLKIKVNLLSNLVINSSQKQFTRFCKVFCCFLHFSCLWFLYRFWRSVYNIYFTCSFCYSEIVFFLACYNSSWSVVCSWELWNLFLICAFLFSSLTFSRLFSFVFKNSFLFKLLTWEGFGL